jgi:coenzyme F420-reducing hydrogenase alpha subunit
MQRRNIKVDLLARVEGEGALRLTVQNDIVQDAELRIFEPPRFFEALLRGRSWTETADIVARICGICPVAYQMSAVHALESIAGVAVEGPLRDLRRLLYCGEWIESHALHVYMLHAPDFLGYQGAIDMARDHANLVQQGLALKKVGNEILEVLGGRAIHPVNVCLGGFYRAPRKRELLPLVEKLKRARELACATVRWVAGFEFFDLERDYELVALRGPGEYPFNAGRIVSDRGLDIAVEDFPKQFQEEHVAHSNALHAHRRGGGAYLTGPLARYSLNFDQLSPLAKEMAKEAGLGPVCKNPFRSIIVRAVELVYACDEALRLIEAYQEPDRSALAVEPRAGVGHAATEAPRGMLYHRYRIDAAGMIQEAVIVPPTSQNQPSIEADLRTFAGGWLNLDDDALRQRCELAIRNHDPCISCATHFLKLDVVRG